MSIETIKTKISSKLTMATGLNARVKLDFGDEGILFVDATQNPPEIHEDDAEADLTITCTLSVFDDILNGTQDPNIAFMMGKLKIKGAMGLAMKLNSILED